MQPEIRAAAERYRREAYTEGRFGDPEFRNVGYLTSDDGWGDRRLLAEAWLHDNPADDDEAIDEAFAKSLGMTEQPWNQAGDTRLTWKHPNFGHARHPARYCQVAWRLKDGVVYVNGLGTSITTRGALRRLVAALNISSQ